MHILLFSNAASTNRGGAEASFEAIADGLAERGHEVHRLHNETGGAADGKHRLSLPWINMRGGLPTPRSAWTFARHLLPLARLLRRLRPDVVVVHFIDLSSLYFAVLRPLLGFRLVLSARGSDLLVQPRQSDRHRKLLPRVLRRADHVVALSQAIAEAAVALCPDVKGRVTVIHNGVDLDFWGETVSPSYTSGPLILSVGRLFPVKGHDILVEALPHVVKKVPDVHVHIAGDGPMAERLVSRAAELGVSDHLTLLGWCEMSQIRKELARATALAMPSRSEGFGNAAIEAMAAGVPVVASEVGGLAEVIVHEQTGLLVPPESPDALAGALVCILTDNKLRAALQRQGRLHAEQYSWRTAIDSYVSVLRGLQNTDSKNI